MPRFIVKLGRTDFMRAEIEVEAANSAEADNLAHQLDERGKIDWYPTGGGDISTRSVQEIEERKPTL